MKMIIERQSIQPQDLRIYGDQDHQIEISDKPIFDSEKPCDPKGAFNIKLEIGGKLDKIQLIKMVRWLTKWGLKDSKDWVEANVEEFR